MSDPTIYVAMDGEQEVSAKDLARLFWDSDGKYQAGFFHELTRIAKHYVFEMQMLYMGEQLSDEARDLIATLAKATAAAE